MPRIFTPPADHPAFADLPVRLITIGSGKLSIATHVSGDFSSGLVPLVGIAGYHRNMSDFAGFATRFRIRKKADWPLILIDLPGRGRSSPRRNKSHYSTIDDMEAIVAVLSALMIPRALFLGQGHGGQTIMTLAAQHPLLVAGAALIDAGAVADPRGLVRLRNNCTYLDGLRGTPEALQAALRQIAAADFPGQTPRALNALALRTHFIDQRGRIRPLFDPALAKRLEQFDTDDVFEPQWRLFDALDHRPLLLMRTQLTDQLRRDTFEEMCRLRPDALALTIEGQGSPALLESEEEISAVAALVDTAQKLEGGDAPVAVRA